MANKKPLTIDEQISLLKSRGLQIKNIESAKISDMLSIINDSSKSFLKSQNVWFYELNINKMRNMNVLEDVILKNISNKEKIIYFSHNISHEIFNIFKTSLNFGFMIFARPSNSSLLIKIIDINIAKDRE